VVPSSAGGWDQLICAHFEGAFDLQDRYEWCVSNHAGVRKLREEVHLYWACNVRWTESRCGDSRLQRWEQATSNSEVAAFQLFHGSVSREIVFFFESDKNCCFFLSVSMLTNPYTNPNRELVSWRVLQRVTNQTDQLKSPPNHQLITAAAQHLIG
jgi:hypothetical protein